MPVPTAQSTTTSTPGANALNPASHYAPLVDAMPAWLGQTSSARRDSLKSRRQTISNQLKSATQTQHDDLRSAIGQQMTAQNAVDQMLERIQDASAFAEPLLKEALQSRFGLKLDVRQTFLQLYIPLTVAGITTGTRTWTVSLLDAALHNFEASETAADAYAGGSSFITRPSSTGQFDTLAPLNAKPGISAFTSLCRELDIGASYKNYLEQSLGMSSPVAAEVLRHKVDAAQKSALRAALKMARMNGDIDEACMRSIESALDSSSSVPMDGQPLLLHDLSMMAVALTGIVVFAPDLQRAKTAVSVVAYVPDDPEHPLKQYTSTGELAKELIRQLRGKDYRRFFSRFIAHEQRGAFFGQLQQRLSQVKYHPPQAGSQLPPWREARIDKPDLQFAVTPIAGELWEQLYQRKLNKILNDAAVIAIPTAMVDRNARWARWDSLVKVAAEIVQIASFVVLPFVPFLGEMMMAYITYQLLDEVFESIVDWSEGQTTQAAEHVFAALESLIQLGGFGVGAGIAMAELPRVLPAEVVAFIDRFQPVKLRNGKTLYWKPDLKTYERTSVPPADSRPDTQGLHAHAGKQMAVIDQTGYAVTAHEYPGKLRIEHPTRAEAYQPVLRHNGEGAFHSELENPQHWDGATVLRRIGHSMEAFTAARRERILSVSGYTEDGLRKMHVDQERVPPLLADSIQRFRIDQDLQTFIQQISSAEPADYLQADPLLQLQLLDQQGRWPSERKLRLSNARGEMLWESSSDELLPLTELRDDSLTDGDLLKTLLQSLSNPQINVLLAEDFGTMLALDVRTLQLRTRLAQIAAQQRPALFEQRYQTLQQHHAPLQIQIADHVPQLPARITEELLQTATGAELLKIGAGQWPERQQQLSQMAVHELRITRAYEGLELQSVSNSDSETLALHSLPLLPGWSENIHLEVRDQSFKGKILDSTGAVRTSVEKVLVRKADGMWQPFDHTGLELHAPTDFYTCVLQALPDAQRKALNLQIGEGQKLKQLIRDNPLPRDNLRLTMAQAPAPVIVFDTLRLLGAEGYPRHTAGPQPTPSLATRVRDIFPGMTPDGVQAMLEHLQSLPGHPLAELSRLRLEYAQLESDLDQWRVQELTVDSASGQVLSPAQRVAAMRDRDMFARALRSCWRRESAERFGNRMRFVEPIMGDLPVLTADFSHVVSLELSGSGAPGGIEHFIGRFPQLARLDLQNFDLHTLPQAISTMPALRQLRLRKCAVLLTPENQAVLTSLNELVELDLKDNPLGSPFNLNFLPALSYINLSRTGIREVPAGLTEHPQIRSAWLTDNLITALPDALFELSPSTAAGYDFSGNPLSAATREQVKTWFGRTGGNLGVRAEQADILRTQALFQNIDEGQASGLIYRLPGSLIQGRLQLTAWEREIATMTADLARWTRDIPDRDPLTGVILTANERFTEQDARETFSGYMQWLWRHRSNVSPHPRADVLTAQLPFLGEMPVLSADFNHITALTLTGNQGIRGTAPFLQSFSRVKRLFLRNFALDQLAQTLHGMPMLESLVLDHCGVTFSAESLSALASMTKLASLELPGNPLGFAPDLQPLAELTYLDLSRTGITETPPGILDHPKLTTAILSDNLISELPEGFYQVSAVTGDGYDLSSNPLSADTRERLKTYSRETGQDFAVLADTADLEATQQLFPSLDAQDASDVFYSLPGSLEQSRRLLRHWQAELQQLTTDLAQWSTAGPAIHPVSGQPLSPRQKLLMQNNRQMFAKRLENLWRARDAEAPKQRVDTMITDLPFIGELPVLSADFSHIAGVTFEGNPTLSGVEAFLASFTGLRNLEMHEFKLGELPQACARMPALERLVLEYCEVRMTAESQSRLSTLQRLTYLNLSHNPLGATPALQTMTALTSVRMIDSGISSLPEGLFELPKLAVATFDYNNIVELPDSLFNLPVFSPQRFSLAENPLSAATRERIKLGYPRNRQNHGVTMPLSDVTRLRALFPTLDVEDANRVLYLLPGTIDEGQLQITQWEAQWQQLVADLGRWVSEVPERHPSTSVALTAQEKIVEQADRQQFRENLEVLWCARKADRPEFRSDALSVDLTLIGELPALTADFSHVTVLSITGNAQLRGGDAFFSCFSGLKTLELRDLGLQRMPTAFRRLQGLQVLVLSNCALVLDAEGSATLSSLTQLTKLDLYNNPLGLAPDIRTLPALDFLDLAGTAITEVPPGLINHPALEIVILSNNRIREIPQHLFDLPAEIGNGYDFGNNPLSAATREQIKQYFGKTGSDLGVLAEEADRARVQTLYPELDNEQASKWIYRLAGSLADGRSEVTRQEGALADLTTTLARWTSNVPADVVGADARLQQEQLREQFAAALLTCWRRIPLEDVSLDNYGFTFMVTFSGELPTLSATFPYVPDVFLVGLGASTRIGRFLEAFTDLDSLAIRSCNLGDLPEVIFRIKRLTALSLPECQITLTPETVAALAGMDKLEVLTLRDNPLRLSPDLSNLRKLSDLDLSGTGITEIPRGVLQNLQWNEVDLSDNAITEVPEELTEVPAPVGDRYDLRNNPLSAASLARIRAYYHETGNDLNVEGISITLRPPELRPDVEIED